MSSLPPEPLPMWQSAGTLSVRDAAALIAGVEPTWAAEHVFVQRRRASGGKPGDIRWRVLAEVSVLQNEIEAGSLPAKIVRGRDEALDRRRTTIKAADLRAWLARHDRSTPFMKIHKASASVAVTAIASSSAEAEIYDYLSCMDKSNPNYAPKLHAALLAWNHVGRELGKGGRGGKSVKEALKKWLKQNARTYGVEYPMSDDVIEEIAKVANWKLKGGAPRTPSTPK